MVSNKEPTKHQEDTPVPPKGDIKEGYQWLFGDSISPDAELKHIIREVQKKREDGAKRRRKGYEWFFE